jgi:hypothetical protein
VAKAFGACRKELSGIGVVGPLYWTYSDAVFRGILCMPMFPDVNKQPFIPQTSTEKAPSRARSLGTSFQQWLLTQNSIALKQ